MELLLNRFNLKESDILLVVPPFWDLDMPCLGIHQLQAAAREAGFEARVLYSNMLFAREIGIEAYIELTMSIDMKMTGERIFAREAWGLEPLGKNRNKMFNSAHALGTLKAKEYGNPYFYPLLERTLQMDDLLEIEKKTTPWLDKTASFIAKGPWKITGVSSSYEQNNASFGLLKKIKQKNKKMITLLGGANCKGIIAEGIRILDKKAEIIDYIFSGESEKVFNDFLKSYSRDELPPNRIISSEPLADLNLGGPNDYSDYFNQLNFVFPAEKRLRESVLIPLETSRGCWWGEKRQCLFCGLAGKGEPFREKTAKKTLEEISSYKEDYSVSQFTTTDIIMPRSYFETLLPALSKAAEPVKLVFEQKIPLSLKKMMALKKAGVVSVLAGVEAFHSEFLKLMNKGAKAWQNIMALRYARAAGVDFMWNLLWGFPADKTEWYRQTLDILPLISHLQPPSGVIHLSLNRYSPYFENPEIYGISNLRPLAGYKDIYPGSVNIESLAYQFIGDYEAESHSNPGIIKELITRVARWKELWNSCEKQPPLLSLNKLGDKYLIADTRGLEGLPHFQVIEPDYLSVCLTAREDIYSEDVKWALKKKWGLIIDSRYIPLVTSGPELIMKAENKEI